MSEDRSWDLNGTLSKASVKAKTRPKDSVTVSEAYREKKANGEVTSESAVRRRLNTAVEMGLLVCTTVSGVKHYHPPVKEERAE